MVNRYAFKQIILTPNLPSPVTGRIYTREGSKTALSALFSRVRSAPIHCEFGFPQLQGLAPSESLKRMNEVKEQLVCAHLTRLHETQDRMIAGVFRFTGPYGVKTKELFSAPRSTSYFGMRSFTSYHPAADQHLISLIITFDHSTARTIDFKDLHCVVKPIPEFWVGETKINLTPKESLTLYALFEATSEDRILTRAELYVQLYGHRIHQNIDSNVVEVFIGRIRRKLKATGSRVSISAIRSLGYTFVTRNPEGTSKCVQTAATA